MAVVFQYGLQCFDLPTINQVVFATQTNVEEHHQIVDFSCLLSDSETCQHAALLATVTRTKAKVTWH